MAKESSATNPGRRAGKPVQFWLHERDSKTVRHLAAWVASQGFRPSDSMIVRAALRIAKTDANLLAACREEALLDGRIRRPAPRKADEE